MAVSEILSLYQSTVMSHHQEPHGFAGEEVDLPWQSEQGFNPACGDEIVVYCEQHQGVVRQLHFSGYSCAICRGSASIMCQQIKDMPLANARSLATSVDEFIKNKPSDIVWQNDIDALSITHQFPVRQQCALLPWQTLIKLLS